MRIKKIKLETLRAYRDAYRCQTVDPGDKFMDGVVVAYRLTLENLGYKESNLMSQEFLHNEIEKLKEQS